MAQELGGKSANIIILQIWKCKGSNCRCKSYLNTGQSCVSKNVGTFLSIFDEAIEIAKNVANSIVVGKPNDEGVRIGPISNRTQYEKVKRLIDIGIEEGAILFAAGLIYLKDLRMDSL